MHSLPPGAAMRPAPQLTLLRRLATLFPAPTRLPLPPRDSPARSVSAAAGPRWDWSYSRAADEDATPRFTGDDSDSDGDGDDAGPSSADAFAPPPPAPAAAPRHTGAFQRLPMVAPSREIIESAVRRAERVGGNKKLKNEGARAKNRAARQLDALMKELAGPLGSYERGFPKPTRLHPFENALLELTVGAEGYGRALARLSALRKAAVEVSKGYAARAGKAPTKREALALQTEGFERVQAVYARGADAVDELKELAKSLRRLPVVDPDLPTVALVGAPNVGKSSLVQLLSSGLPEVQNYPFTTRSIKMGHFYVDGRRHQVTDTPGLLNRPEEDRNAMERLTLATLAHLPTAVLFVADLTGECGTSVPDQWAIRRELRQRFPEKPWIDVLSKADLLEEELDAADDVNRSRNGDVGAVGSVEQEPARVADAVAFAAAVPAAQRVSSLTGAGVDALKAALLEMLEAAELRNEGLEAWEALQREEAEEDGAGAEEEPFYNGPPVLMT